MLFVCSIISDLYLFHVSYFNFTFKLILIAQVVNEHIGFGRSVHVRYTLSSALPPPQARALPPRDTSQMLYAFVHPQESELSCSSDLYKHGFTVCTPIVRLLI